ncbi:MAG: hypothetical protein DRN12_00590 [Thermoplasmata archaeon]|mgnify:CR=1 FL=1|nr:MAG: hypothetical protein DRN12_00590 [Thermoplasmata archaeon]
MKPLTQKLREASLYLIFPLFLAQETPFPDENFTRIVEHLPGIGWFMGLGLLIVCLIFIILPLVITLLLCIWIYKDAEQRGREGILWVILLILSALIFNIFGIIFIVILWLAVRPPLPSR